MGLSFEVQIAVSDLLEKYTEQLMPCVSIQGKQFCQGVWQDFCQDQLARLKEGQRDQWQLSCACSRVTYSRTDTCVLFLRSLASQLVPFRGSYVSQLACHDSHALDGKHIKVVAQLSAADWLVLTKQNWLARKPRPDRRVEAVLKLHCACKTARSCMHIEQRTYSRDGR